MVINKTHDVLGKLDLDFATFCNAQDDAKLTTLTLEQQLTTLLSKCRSTRYTNSEQHYLTCVVVKMQKR